MVTKLKGPEVGCCASVDGIQYVSDEEGNILVDNADHVGILTRPPHEWAVVAPPARSDVLVGSDEFPATIDVGLSTPVSLGDVVAIAHRKSGLSVDDWNDLDEDDRDDLLDDVIAGMRSANGWSDAPPVNEAAPEPEPEPQLELQLEDQTTSGTEPGPAGDDTTAGAPGEDTVAGQDGADSVAGPAGDDTTAGSDTSEPTPGAPGGDAVGEEPAWDSMTKAEIVAALSNLSGGEVVRQEAEQKVVLVAVAKKWWAERQA